MVGSFAPLAQESTGSGSIQLVVFLGLMFVMFYFLLIRPQKRRTQQQRDLLSSVDVGDDVMTTAGMFGTITDMDEETFTLEVAEGVEIRFLRVAIARKLSPDQDDETGYDEDEEAGAVADEDEETGAQT